MSRFLPHPGLSVLLALMWAVMVGDVTFGTLLLGMVFAVLVPIFTAPWWPERPSLRFGPAVAYCLVVLWDILVANFHVAGIVLFKRNSALRPAWLTIPLELTSPEAIAVFAGTISLTPGTVSADVSACGKFLLVHALDTADPAAEVARAKARYEARLLEVFR